MLCCGLLALLVGGALALARRIAAAPRGFLIAVSALIATGLPLAAWALTGPADAQGHMGPICGMRLGN